MKNAQKLISDVDNKIRTNEYNTVTLKGIKNISRSDLETVKLYAETYIKNGGNYSGLVSPYGNVKELLEAYGLPTPY